VCPVTVTIVEARIGDSFRGHGGVNKEIGPRRDYVTPSGALGALYPWVLGG